MKRFVPSIPLARIFLATIATLGAANSHAKELQSSDLDYRLARIGIQAKAERVLHHRKPFLLLRLTPVHIRTIDRPDGSIDSISLESRGMPFLPVEIACDRIVLKFNGTDYKPDPASLCRGDTTLQNYRAPPLFIAFPYPGKGGAKIEIPVTVKPPRRPIETVLNRRTAPVAVTSEDKLIGARTLTLGVLLDDPSEKNR